MYEMKLLREGKQEVHSLKKWKKESTIQLHEV